MKTNQKQNKSAKVFKTLLFLGVVAILLVFGIKNQESVGEKYSINKAGFDDKAGYEVSYINLTGKETIKDRKIKLSEGYWSSGKFNF